jgi:hypothetical protein
MQKPNGFYNSDHLKMLSRVLEEALIVSVDGTQLTESAMQELISRVGKVMMAHFTAGETDPEALKKIAMQSVQER